MSEYERGRSYKKKYISKVYSMKYCKKLNKILIEFIFKDLPNNVGRNIINKYNKSNEDEEIKIKQPTLLLKAREQEETVNSPKKSSRDNESTSNQSVSSSNVDGRDLYFIS